MLYNIKPISLQRVFHGIRFKVNEDWVSGIDNIKPISLQRVFHGIRFKVNEDWVSGIDTLLFYVYFSSVFLF